MKRNQGAVGRRVFCTFADSRLSRTLKRIEKQAMEIGVYDEVLVLDERHLDSSFRREFSNRLSRKVRGFGYWVWKPQAVLQTMRSLDEGDIVHYVDSGCWINAAGKKRLIDYFEICRKSTTGYAVFQVPQDAPTEELSRYTLPERCWTKGDLLDYFGVRANSFITDTNQVEATSFFVRVDENTVDILERWLDVFRHDFSLCDDAPSRSPNLDGFIEHRHDQSVFSLIMKSIDAVRISSFEYCLPCQIDIEGKTKWVADWDGIMLSMPIWAKRDKDFGPFWALVAKLKRYSLKWAIRKAVGV